jgi:hypothetical protein
MGARLGAICTEIESVDDVFAQISLAYPVMAAAGLFRVAGKGPGELNPHRPAVFCALPTVRLP